MQKIILYTVVVLVSFVSKLYAQENDSLKKMTFEKKAKERIEEIDSFSGPFFK